MDFVMSLILAMWGASTAVLAFTKELNGIRDKVMYGVSDGNAVPAEHRRHLLRNDWVPLAVAVNLLLLAFGLVVLVLPLSVQEPQRSLLAWTVSGVVFLTALVGAVASTVTEAADYRAMNAKLKAMEENSSSPTSSPPQTDHPYGA